MNITRPIILFSIFVWIILGTTSITAHSQANVLNVSSPTSASGETTTAKLTINNKTGAQFTLKLTGQRTYNFLVPNGKSAVLVEKGEYQYEYPACGNIKKGVLEISSKTKLNTVVCKIVKFSIVNRTNHPVTVVLDGPARYTFTFDFPPLDARILVGTYQYKVYTSCGSESGSLNVVGGRRYAVDCPDTPGEKILKLYSRFKKR